MFKKILVPVDGSETSSAGVRLAVQMAAESGAEIVFAHVVDLTQATVISYPGPDVGYVLKTGEKAGQRLLDDAKAIAAKAGVKCSQALVEGRRLEALLDLIKTQSADLVLIGSHGRGGIARALVGSTAEGILRNASVPVLVATHKSVAATPA